MQRLFATSSHPETIALNDNPEKPLFGKHFSVHSLGFLSSSSNFFRSAFAVQLGHAWATGSPLQGIEMNAVRKRVLYIDGHRSFQEFLACYTDKETGEVFSFDDNFIHASFLRSNFLPDSWSLSFENKLVDQLNELIAVHNSEIIIFDSADWLLSLGCSLKDLNRFMLTVRNWVISKGLSVLFLISPFEINSTWNQNRQLRLFYNEVTSIFSLCRSRFGSNIFYIRDDVSLTKTPSINPKVLITAASFNNSFWNFTMENYEYEFHHSLTRPANLPLIVREMASELRDKGYSYREIGVYLGISKSYVHKMLASHKIENSGSEKGTSSTVHMVDSNFNEI